MKRRALLGMYLRTEKKEWIPRMDITDDSIGESMKKELKAQN